MCLHFTFNDCKFIGINFENGGLELHILEYKQDLCLQQPHTPGLIFTLDFLPRFFPPKVFPDSNLLPYVLAWGQLAYRVRIQQCAVMPYLMLTFQIQPTQIDTESSFPS